MSPAFRVVHKPRLYFSRRGKLVVYAVLGVTWSSGLAWLILHYLLTRHGEFGDEPHPLESWALALHGACAFAGLWLGGWLWSTHISPWWISHKRRSSGIVLIGMAVLLIVSGYLLYYASDENIRGAIRILHWSVGLALALPVLVHALRSGRYRYSGDANQNRSQKTHRSTIR
jgi:hypothetical protein